MNDCKSGIVKRIDFKPKGHRIFKIGINFKLFINALGGIGDQQFKLLIVTQLMKFLGTLLHFLQHFLIDGDIVLGGISDIYGIRQRPYGPEQKENFKSATTR